MRYLVLVLLALTACPQPKYTCDREAYQAFVLECASHSGDTVSYCRMKADQLFCTETR